MNLGIFLPNWIGDVAMATPTLRALRRHFGPQAHLVGIMRPYVRDVLAGTPWLDEVVLYDPRGNGPALRGWPFLRTLRACRLDTVVLLTNSLRTAVWARLSGAQRRVGYSRAGRGPLLTHPLLPPHDGRRFIPTPAVDYYLNLAYLLGCLRESPRLELATVPADEQAADAVWDRLQLPRDEPVVALNSGGAFGAAKSWPAEYFARLASRIANEQGLHVLVLCGPSERTIAAEIEASAEHPRVVSLANQTLSIGLTKACIRRSGLLVTTDSGPRHFAAAFDVPVITLFGPTHQAWSETYFPRAIHLQAPVDCGPCQQRVCPFGHHRCMRELSVERVYRAVEQQLAKEPQRRAA
ncbi:MAG: lipopolysaccharide heptosyltransferase II [Planctomycetes bacterium]|nr:lipopolysaccharide heptosyltransferase II [Planctomycetota bacterium]